MVYVFTSHVSKNSKTLLPSRLRLFFTKTKHIILLI